MTAICVYHEYVQVLCGRILHRRAQAWTLGHATCTSYLHPKWLATGESQSIFWLPHQKMSYCCSIPNGGSYNSGGMGSAVSTWSYRLWLHCWGASKKGFGRSDGKRAHAKGISQRVHTWMVYICWQPRQRQLISKNGRSRVLQCQEDGSETLDNPTSHSNTTAWFCFIIKLYT